MKYKAFLKEISVFQLALHWLDAFAFLVGWFVDWGKLGRKFGTR